MNKLKNIKCVIFDMDGVLVDSEQPYLNIFPDVCLKHGYTITHDDVMNTLGTTYQYTGEYLKKVLGNDFPYDFLSEKFQEELVAMAYAGKLPLKPNVRDILEYLKHKGYLIALASSNSRFAVENYLKAFDIADYFNSILSGDDVENGKPDPSLFLLSAKNLGVEPSECLVIEDSLNGVMAARAADMVSVMVPDLMPYSDQVKDYVDYCFENIFDVSKLI